MFTNVQSSISIRVVAMNAAGSANSPTLMLTVLKGFDHDGMPDLWEIQDGFNTNSAADALLDFDEDGMINRDEYVAGTHPTNASSVLKILLTATNSGLLQFVAQTNLGYTVQYRTNLETALWINLTNFTSSSRVRTVLVNAPNPPPDLERFYRVVTPPVP